MYLISSIILLLVILFRNSFKNQSISKIAYLLWRIVVVSFTFSGLFFYIDISEVFPYSYVLVNLPFETVKHWMKYIYLIGVAVFIIIGLVNYVRMLVYHKRCEHIEVKECWNDTNTLQAFESFQRANERVKLYFDPRTSSTYTFGIFNMRVYLSPNCLEDTYYINAVLDHEAVHIMRKDCLWKMFGYLCLCINWFNPVVWLLNYQLSKDSEISDDYIVTNGKDDVYRQQYIDNIKQEVLAEISPVTEFPFCNYFVNDISIVKERAIAMKIGKSTRNIIPNVVIIVLCIMVSLVSHVRFNTGIHVMEILLNSGEEVIRFEHRGEGPDGKSIDVITTTIPVEAQEE